MFYTSIIVLKYVAQRPRQMLAGPENRRQQLLRADPRLLDVGGSRHSGRHHRVLVHPHGTRVVAQHQAGQGHEERGKVRVH